MRGSPAQGAAPAVPESNHASLWSARAQHLRVLAAALAEPPDMSVIEHLRGHELGRAFGLVFGSTVAELHRRFAHDESAQTYKRAYDQLFVLPSTKRLVLTESHARDRVGTRQKALLQGPSALTVAHFYQEHGFARSGHAFADHAATELSFVALLCEQAAAAASEGEAREAQEVESLALRFTEQHLAAWLPEICAQARMRCDCAGLEMVLTLLPAVLTDLAQDQNG